MRILLFLFFSYPVLLLSQVPFAFNYQGIARNGQGEAIGNEEISLLVSIVRGFENGIIEFSEQHFVTTGANGLFTIRIGQGNFITGNLRNIDWGIDDYFIRTELDPAGGENYVELGTSQLYAVPYALFALKSAESDQGGSGADNQTLSLSGNFLSIENGNSIDLSPIKDGVEDADADPVNELQNLSISGSQLSISNGNSVTLPSGGGSGGDSPWQIVDNNSIAYTGTAEIRNNSGNSSLLLGTNSTASGQAAFLNQNAGSVAHASYADGESGFFSYAQDEKLSHWLGTDDETGDGFLQLRSNNQISLLLRSLDNTANLSMRGPNGNNNILLTNLSSSKNAGFIATGDSEGQTKAAIYVSENEAGKMYTRGPNGNTNIFLNNLASNANHGYLTVNDAQGDDKAGAYVNASGQGVLFADVKNFRTEHPALEDHDIVYASLEGPEAAAYMRGTAKLVDGKAEIQFPEHFKYIISTQTSTVMLTPLSPKSKGLSVLQKSNDGFSVVELWEGKGNYEFDWEVKAIRQGFENYQVVRKHDLDYRPAGISPRESEPAFEPESKMKLPDRTPKK